MHWALVSTLCAWWSGKQQVFGLLWGQALPPYPIRSCHASVDRRGDHTYAECCLTVVSRGTEAVVFSIDGSFTASVSIMGSDPKVRAGAVDVVR